MNVLGIETATSRGSIAIIDSKGFSFEYLWTRENAHSEEIFSGIDKVLKKAKKGLQNIDGIAVSIGPGSFTGIRIGVTVARTISQILNKRIAGISTLDNLAFDVKDDKSLVCPIIDALRGEVYTALYGPLDKYFKNRYNGYLGRLTDYHILNIEELLDRFLIDYVSNFKKVIFLGPAVSVYRKLIKEKLSKKAINSSIKNTFPKAINLAIAGDKIFLTDKKEKWNKILPFYMRESEAEVNPVRKFMKVVFR